MLNTPQSKTNSSS